MRTEKKRSSFEALGKSDPNIVSNLRVTDSRLNEKTRGKWRIPFWPHLKDLGAGAEKYGTILENEGSHRPDLQIERENVCWHEAHSR